MWPTKGGPISFNYMWNYSMTQLISCDVNMVLFALPSEAETITIMTGSLPVFVQQAAAAKAIRYGHDAKVIFTLSENTWIAVCYFIIYLIVLITLITLNVEGCWLKKMKRFLVNFSLSERSSIYCVRWATENTLMPKYKPVWPWRYIHVVCYFEIYCTKIMEQVFR